MRKENPDEVRRLAQASIAKEVEAMLAFKERGAVVFDNGNNIRSQADEHGVKNAFSIDIFTARYLCSIFFAKESVLFAGSLFPAMRMTSGKRMILCSKCSRKQASGKLDQARS